jgi:hypothetical protein
VDLSAFLERQRLDDNPPSSIEKPKDEDDEDDIDHSLLARSSKLFGSSSNKKGQVHQIEWDKDMDELRREKLSTEAVRGSSYYLHPCPLPFHSEFYIELKARFRGERVNTDRYGQWL